MINLQYIAMTDGLYSGSKRLIALVRAMTDEEFALAKINHTWPLLRSEEVAAKIKTMWF